MFYAEIISCKPMLVNDKEGNQIWRYTRHNLVDDCNIQDMADAFWLIMGALLLFVLFVLLLFVLLLFVLLLFVLLFVLLLFVLF